MVDETKLTPGICTQCGAQIEVDAQKDAAICPYCGTPYIVEKAILKYNTVNIHNTNVHNQTKIHNVQVGKQGAVASILNFVDKQLEQKRKKEEEERRRLEEEQRKREERMKKMRTQIAGKQYQKRNLIILSAMAGLILAFVIVGAIGNSLKGDEPEPVSNDIAVPMSSMFVEGENYENIVKRFQNAGFTNVKTKPLEDLITGWLTKDGAVEEVSIEGYTTFSSGDKFDKGADIVITYHTFSQRETSSVEEPVSTETPSPESKNVEEPFQEMGESTNEPVSESEPQVEEPTYEPVPEPEPESESVDTVLTADNNEELAALLRVRDPDDPIVSEFANKYQGRTIVFNGYIADMAPHGKTRYDMLISVGNYGDTTLVGPYFQFKNVSGISLNFTGDNIPDSVKVGTNLRITAKVGDYSSTTSLFQLSPISTEVR